MISSTVKIGVAALGFGIPASNGANLTMDLPKASPGVGVLTLSASIGPKNLGSRP